jgi:hypothetical protein
MKNLSLHSWSLGRDVNPELPEYEAECYLFDFDVRFRFSLFFLLLSWDPFLIPPQTFTRVIYTVSPSPRML